jgi:hypothetical protein
MHRLRVATEAEVDKIKAQSDLDQTCKVLALDTAKGTAFAVLRIAVELDPAFYPEGFGAKEIAMFTRDIENYLWAQGSFSYYFNVNPEDMQWISNIKTWGAEQVSKQPELRFKKVL